MTRLVVDASVLLSASVAAPNTPLALLMGAVRSGAVEMVVCEQLLGEVRRGLDGAYFRVRLTAEERETSLAAIARIGLTMDGPISPPSVVRDPDDDYLVALAKASRQPRSSRETGTCSTTKVLSRRRSLPGRRVFALASGSRRNRGAYHRSKRCAQDP